MNRRQKNETYKCCLMCQTVDTGIVKFSLKTYEQLLKNHYDVYSPHVPFPKLTHGICEKQDCKTAMYMHSLGCNKKEALEIISELETKINE